MTVKFQINGREFTGTVEATGWFEVDQVEECHAVAIDGFDHITKRVPVSACEALD